MTKTTSLFYSIFLDQISLWPLRVHIQQKRHTEGPHPGQARGAERRQHVATNPSVPSIIKLKLSTNYLHNDDIWSYPQIVQDFLYMS